MLARLAFRNVIVHWRQSVAALLSISGAFFCYASFQGYMLNVEDLYRDAYRNRGMYGDALIEDRHAAEVEGKRDAWRYMLHEEERRQVAAFLARHRGEIEVDVRQLVFQGLVSTGRSSKIFLGQAYDIGNGARMRASWGWNVLYGQPLEASGFERPVEIGQSLGLQIGCEPIRKVRSLLPEGGYKAEVRPFKCLRDDVQLAVTTTRGTINALDLRVAGIVDGGYKEIDSRYVAMPLPLAQQLINSSDITMWTLKLKPGIDVPSWIRGANAELQAINPEIHAVSWMDHPTGDLYRRTMSLLRVFGTFVTIVVVFISALSVTNTMVKIVKERTREIGTLLSLGFQRAFVLKVFLAEALFLALLGCVIGIVATAVNSWAVNRLGITYKAGLFSDAVPLRILIDCRLYLEIGLGLALITVLTSYLCCRSAVSKKIVECLGFA